MSDDIARFFEQPFPLTCPECNQHFQETLGKLEQKREVVCPVCGYAEPGTGSAGRGFQKRIPDPPSG